MKRALCLMMAAGMALSVAGPAFAHCQIPCGIYGDDLRFNLMSEEIVTIEKSMTEINRLAEDPAPNVNQLVRWVNNKDEHADSFTEIVTQYFLAQRIKPVEPTDKEAFAKYQEQLTLLHQMMVFSMKCKQTTDLANVTKLRELVAAFHKSYWGPEAAEHMLEHHD